MKIRLLILVLVFQATTLFAQQGLFDVFSYEIPPFFTKTENQSVLRFNLSNEDGSFCTITLYKSRRAMQDILQDITSQWKVVKKLPGANKKPLKILTEQFWDGWASTLAIGNFDHNKKKAIVMLHSFRRNNTTAFAVFAFTDKIYKGPVEAFSKNLHLNTTQKNQHAY